jgi:hypothetical protein
MDRKRARLLCLILAGFFLIACWWPFTPFPRNQVSWMAGTGLSFAPPGVAYDPEPLPIAPGSSSSSSAPGVALELSLETGIEPNSSFPHILTIHDGRAPSNVVVGQWQDELLVRVPTQRNRRQFREVGVSGFRKGQPRVVVISSDEAATSFYVDGKLSKRVPGFVLGLDTLRGQLILGSAPTGRNGWTGTILGIAIFNRALAAKDVAAHQAIWTGDAPLELAREPGLVALYTFTGSSASNVSDHSPAKHHLTIPGRYVVLDRTVLGNPGMVPHSARAATDVVLNVLLFVPFGFLAFFSFTSASGNDRIRTAILATLAGALLSMAIEVGQVWLPTRDSSLRDLAYNTVGTGVGALLGLWASYLLIRTEHVARWLRPE